jgi:hypothetical protein
MTTRAMRGMAMGLALLADGVNDFLNTRMARKD